MIDFEEDVAMIELIKNPHINGMGLRGRKISGKTVDIVIDAYKSTYKVVDGGKEMKRWLGEKGRIALPGLHL